MLLFSTHVQTVVTSLELITREPWVLPLMVVSASATKNLCNSFSGIFTVFSETRILARFRELWHWIGPGRSIVQNKRKEEIRCTISESWEKREKLIVG